MRLHEPWKRGTTQAKEIIGLFLSPYVVELSLDSNSKFKIETNEFIKTHILQPTNKHIEYHFAFCGKYNSIVEPVTTKFNTRFGGKGFLKFQTLNQLVTNPGSNPNDDEYSYDWEHYSWKCRFAIIPDKNHDSVTIKNEDLVKTLKSEFVQVLMFLNELCHDKKLTRQRTSTVSAPSADSVTGKNSRLSSNNNVVTSSPGYEDCPVFNDDSENAPNDDEDFEECVEKMKKLVPSYKVLVNGQ